MKELPNGCFVDARYHQWVTISKEKSENISFFSNLIGFEWIGGGGHVIHVFNHKNQTWVYDPAIGSFKISNRIIYDPVRILYLSYPDKPVKNIVIL
jgi:hypothetical protein